MENGIVSVKSDHPDPADLTTSPAGFGGQVHIFTIQGQPGLDPLQYQGQVQINPDTAMSIPAFWRAVSFIAQTIAGLQKKVYRYNFGKVPVEIDHPITWTLNDEIGPINTPFVFWSTFIHHAVAWSNAYAALRKEPGQDMQLWNLHPSRVIPFRFEGALWYAYDTGQQNQDKDNRYLIFADYEMLHLPGLSLDGERGLAMVRTARGSLSTAKATEQYVNKFHSQGGQMGGAIETDQPLTKEQIDTYVNQIRNQYSGVDKAFRWMVLGHGLKANALKVGLDTGQVAENRDFSVLEICRLTGVPPHVLFDISDSSKYDNMELLGREVVQYTLKGWIIPLDQECTRKMLTTDERKKGLRVCSDLSHLMEGDTTDQTNNASKRVNTGLTTRNEERAKMSLEPMPDGDKLYYPVNTAPVGEKPLAPLGSPPPKSDEENDADEKKDSAAATLRPVFDSVIARVDQKTRVAFDNHSARADKIIWANVFAEQQAKFVAESLVPVSASMVRLGAGPLPVKIIGERYAQAIRKQASDGTPADLAKIINPLLEPANE